MSDDARPLEDVAIGSLTQDPRNARRHTDRNKGLIRTSLDELGAGRSILLARDGTILAGNATAEAAAAAGFERVLVVPTDGKTLVAVRRDDLDPNSDEAARLSLLDNRTSELAEWDVAVLAGIAGDVDVGPMWTADELAAITRSIAAPPAEPAAEDEIPEPPADPITKRGDTWELGPHRLRCGDCRDTADHDALLAPGSVAVVVTSPPYASQRDYDASSGFEKIPPDRYTEWFWPLQRLLAGALSPPGSFFLNIKPHAEAGQRSLYVVDLVAAMVREGGWLWVDEFCWRNTANGVPGTWPNRFKNAWEPVHHFARQGRITFRPNDVAQEAAEDRVHDRSRPNKKEATGSKFTDRPRVRVEGATALPSNVIEARAETGQPDHSAPFPVDLPDFFIRAYSDAGDLVYDPFVGSGTTLIAADRLNRAARCIELSPAYCDVIVRRYEQTTGNKAEYLPAE